MNQQEFSVKWEEYKDGGQGRCCNTSYLIEEEIDVKKIEANDKKMKSVCRCHFSEILNLKGFYSQLLYSSGTYPKQVWKKMFRCLSYSGVHQDAVKKIWIEL